MLSMRMLRNQGGRVMNNSDGRVKRDVCLAGKSYTLTIDSSGLRLVPKPQAEGSEHSGRSARNECFLIGYDQDEIKLSS